MLEEKKNIFCACTFFSAEFRVQISEKHKKKLMLVLKLQQQTHTSLILRINPLLPPKWPASELLCRVGSGLWRVALVRWHAQTCTWILTHLSALCGHTLYILELQRAFQSQIPQNVALSFFFFNAVLRSDCWQSTQVKQTKKRVSVSL